MTIDDKILWHPQLTSTAFMMYCKIKSLLDGDDEGVILSTQLAPFPSALTTPIRQLKELGFIQVIKRPGTTSVYRLLK